MVTGLQTSVGYISDGATTVWAIPFYFFTTGDIVVFVSVNGVVVQAINGTDFVVSGTPDSYGAYPSGGNITWQSGSQWSGPPPSAATFVILRNTAKTQLNTFVDNSPFPATVLEHGLDKLTLIAQELSVAVGAVFGAGAPGPPTSGTYYVGQWFVNSSPSPGGNFGWICTASGTPGTWTPFGAISLS